VRELQKWLTAQARLVSPLENVLSQVKAHQQLLDAYVCALPTLLFVDQHDDNTFNATATHDGCSMQVKMDAFHKRLSDILLSQQNTSFLEDLTSLIPKLQKFLSMIGEYINLVYFNEISKSLLPFPKKEISTLILTTCNSRTFPNDIVRS
jgi:hypothetical protein